MDDIDGKSHKMELNSSRNYSTNHIKPNSHHLLFMATGVYTHTCIHSCNESDFKKLGAPAARTPGLTTSLIQPGLDSS